MYHFLFFLKVDICYYHLANAGFDKEVFDVFMGESDYPSNFITGDLPGLGQAVNVIWGNRKKTCEFLDAIESTWFGGHKFVKEQHSNFLVRCYITLYIINYY